jgi:hypothetical protein
MTMPSQGWPTAARYPHRRHTDKVGEALSH